MSLPGTRTRGWDAYWFGEASLLRLAALRIALLLAALYAVHQFQPAVMQHARGVESGFLRRGWTPIYLFELLGLQPMGETVATTVYVALVAAILIGLLGIATRVACAVVAVLLLFWAGTAYSFGQPHHDCIALALGLCALPLGPVGSRLSVTSLVRRWRLSREWGAPIELSERAEWAAVPVRLTQLTLAIGYFFAGASKLWLGGLAWANGYTLQGIMLEFDAPWAPALVRSAPLCAALSVGLLFVQVSFPLVLVRPRTAWFYVPMGVLFHLLAWKTMSTGPFLTAWFALVAFVAVERIPALVAELRERNLAERLGALLVLTAAGAFVARIYVIVQPLWVRSLVWAALALALACAAYVVCRPIRPDDDAGARADPASG